MLTAAGVTLLLAITSFVGAVLAGRTVRRGREHFPDEWRAIKIVVALAVLSLVLAILTLVLGMLCLLARVG